ncbi:MAG: hypothetical protein WEB06_02420 [Actinomycetota bacterium]
MTHRRRTGPYLLVAALMVIAAACSDSTPGSAGSASPTPVGSGSVTPAPSPSPAAPAAAIKAPNGWRTFAYQTIAFAYPPLPGTVSAASDGETGPRYAWTIRRSDRCDPRGTCRSYEFAAVNDGCPGTEGWPTFAHRWIQSGGKHSVSTCAGKDSFEIKPLRIVTRPDGLSGVIYDANAWFVSKADVRIPGALAAVLNFPKGFHARYEAIAFYFEDPAALDTIETVLRAVTLES